MAEKMQEARRAPGLVLVIALAGCVPPHVPVNRSFDNIGAIRTTEAGIPCPYEELQTFQVEAWTWEDAAEALLSWSEKGDAVVGARIVETYARASYSDLEAGAERAWPCQLRKAAHPEEMRCLRPLNFFLPTWAYLYRAEGVVVDWRCPEGVEAPVRWSTPSGE